MKFWQAVGDVIEDVHDTVKEDKIDKANMQMKAVVIAGIFIVVLVLVARGK